MAQIAKIEVQLEIKSSAEKFFEVFRSKQYLVPSICPDLVKNTKIVKGDWESVGSIKEWAYVGGNSETVKELVEAIDDKNKTITLKVLEGNFTNYYKSMTFTVQVTGIDKGGSLVKWTVYYEKKSDDLPDPINKYWEFFQVVAKKIDEYLTRNA